MSDPIVLLHGSANGSYSWGQVRRALASKGAKVLAPDMLGYGDAPAPSERWTLLEEVEPPTQRPSQRRCVALWTVPPATPRREDSEYGK